MTSAEIRQSFLDFFQRHGHTIVRSSPLLPESPGLLFTNAGMNQFVPIFLGDRAPDVSRWGDRVLTPVKDTRAADTQKCIRAGGKHNDLEDVGWDTYHHTFFEMLGNWSFGDYFKRESLEWGWELLTKVWGIPAKRLFATVYCPADALGHWDDILAWVCANAERGAIKSFPFGTDAQNLFFGADSPATKLGLKENPDIEAAYWWAEIFLKDNLSPKVHIVPGNRKDNFWMMGDTGPCGPCSEIHFNLLPDEKDDPEGKTLETKGRALVNAGNPRCIEIWNHVFIQFNANADGTFSPLAAKHVDTGMGFERVAGIYATTKGFKDFTKDPSNYAADIFAPLFAKIAELSGKTYTGTVPQKREGLSDQENTDIAFRVLADHARCVSCAIADGILPSNEGRNYVIRRILRRGILYGKKLGLSTGFFEQLVTPVVESLGSVFPELHQQQNIIQRVIRAEEENFGRTLDRGLKRFEEMSGYIDGLKFEGDKAFELYDTYGFPLDMTQLLVAERHHLPVDVEGFQREMDKQRERGRAAQKKDIIVAATLNEGASASDAPDAEIMSIEPSKFLGYDRLTAEATVTDIVKTDKAMFLVFDQTPFYAEMGGQAGDHGAAKIDGQNYAILDVVKDKSGRHLHELAPACALDLSKLPDAGRSLIGKNAQLGVSPLTRRAISRHHTAAHLIHWALRKVLGTHVRQAGTSKTKHRLRFDFVHFEQVKPEQLREIERLVNDKVLENAPVYYAEVPYSEVKGRPDILQFFGDKYGDIVRVVQIGGEKSTLNGYSMELCGGTHVTTTGEIGLVKIVAEMAIAAGTRRLEAVAGQPAYDFVLEEEEALKAVDAKLNAGPQDVVQKLDAVIAHAKELEKKLKAYEQRAAAGLADDLAAKAETRDGLKFVSAVVTTDSPESLRSLGSQVIAKIGEGVVTLGAAFGEKASVVAFCSPAAIKAGHQAGKLVSALSAQLGGKGGGKPDFAMGGGRDVARLADVLRG